MPVFAADEDHHTETIGLNAFFEKDYDTTLLDHNATGHMTFVEDMRGKVVGTLAMEVLAMIYGEEPEPNEAKYMEVLINIMMTYEMENAADISEQCKMDTLKTAESLGMDALEIGMELLFISTETDAAAEPLMDWIKKAAECLQTIADNTENWIEGISDLNTLLQNYSKHDAFLYQIESLATGKLQSAATKLRASMTSAMQIKLETYTDISEANFQNYSKFFFEEVFFEALKLTEEYATDEGFQFFVDLGSDVIEVWDVVDVIELGVKIGKFVGNVAVNGEDIVNRVLEMKAVYDISVVLEHWLKDIKKRISAPYTEAMDNWAIDYVRSGNYLISCRIRGEYCMYSLLAKDSGLYSHFGEKTAQQAENVYNSLTMTLAEIKEQLDGILSVLIVNVGSEMPYEAVNANSKWNVYGRNGQLYDNYTLRIYDKQNLLNFVHTGPMDDPDPTVTEYVIDNTEPFVITLEAGYAYTFEFVDNADSENIKLITVGVTDNDPILTSVVDVETDFAKKAVIEETTEIPIEVPSDEVVSPLDTDTVKKILLDHQEETIHAFYSGKEVSLRYGSLSIGAVEWYDLNVDSISEIPALKYSKNISQLAKENDIRFAKVSAKYISNVLNVTGHYFMIFANNKWYLSADILNDGTVDKSNSKGKSQDIALSLENIFHITNYKADYSDAVGSYKLFSSCGNKGGIDILEIVDDKITMILKYDLADILLEVNGVDVTDQYYTKVLTGKKTQVCFDALDGSFAITSFYGQTEYLRYNPVKKTWTTTHTKDEFSQSKDAMVSIVFHSISSVRVNSYMIEYFVDETLGGHTSLRVPNNKSKLRVKDAIDEGITYTGRYTVYDYSSDGKRLVSAYGLSEEHNAGQWRCYINEELLDIESFCDHPIEYGDEILVVFVENRVFEDTYYHWNYDIITELSYSEYIEEAGELDSFLRDTIDFEIAHTLFDPGE